jgi:hypothetical protein
MKTVFLCSPYKDDYMNRAYVEQACRWCVKAGYLPIAPHAYFTRFLDDSSAEERELGIKMGIELLNYCDEFWVLGNELSTGMKTELLHVINEMGLPPSVKFKAWKEVGVEHWTEREITQDSSASVQELDPYIAAMGTTDT